MNTKTNIAWIALIIALAAGVSTAAAQQSLLSDDFNDGDDVGWSHGAQGNFSAATQQYVVSGSFGSFAPSDPLATHVAAIHALPVSDPLPDNQSLELRADLVGADPGDTFAAVHFLWPTLDNSGYAFFKNGDELWLLKFWNQASSLAFFFRDTSPVKNQNITLVLALTRVGTDVRINTRVLDKDNADAVLFDRSVTDTPQADPALPNHAVRGTIAGPDLSGVPWPVTSVPTAVEVTLTWCGLQPASSQAIFDNVEVRQYESPPMTIQNAVVLAWPLTEGNFVVESAPGVGGPWSAEPDLWLRVVGGKNQVCILASGGAKIFRLRQVP